MPLSGTDDALITAGPSTSATLMTVVVNRRSSQQTMLSQEALAFRTRLWDKQLELYVELIRLADRAAELRRVKRADALEFALEDEDQKLA